VSDAKLLDLRDLSVLFRTARGTVQALDGMSLSIAAGETVALVGESGSGKTVAALALMRLLPRTARIAGGSAMFQGADLLAMDEPRLVETRGARIGMVFQEPMTSLNPVLRIGEQVAEPLLLHRGLTRRQALAEARDLLRLVRLPDADALLHAYPHQLSGGMRQRVMIAQAIACRPALLIADEPTTALDVTVQAQILALLARLQRDLGMALLLITHDLGVVAQVAARTVVLYAGRVAETAPTARLLAAPAHPYTRGLLGATLDLDGASGGRIPEIPGSVTPIAAPLPECHFAPRCALAMPACRAARPLLRAIAPGHDAACIRADA
jgi:oligopeptide/dipeptide ABC transporter ATP-binding protein